MGGLFQALSSGLARFVYAWLLPSVLTLAAFVYIVWPQLDVHVDLGTVGGTAALALTALGLSVSFAYGSRPIFQFFEGYTMPRWLAVPLLRRQQQRYLRLCAFAKRATTETARDTATEHLRGYPDGIDHVLPTRMGNALRGMETYGVNRFGLDSQAFWYELRATTSDKLWQSVEEARGAVDFFMSSMTHLMLLALGSLIVAPWCANPVPALVVTAVSVLATPALYRQTVTSIIEWRYAVQALVNLTRPALAEGMGLRMPTTHRAERDMWVAMHRLVLNGSEGPKDPTTLLLDKYRRIAPFSE